jgi:hypothetical protein
MSAEQVAKAINATRRAEVIKVIDGDKSIQIIHRILPRDKPRLAEWLAVLEYVLSRKQGWDEHVCKRYFYQSGKILYAWNFIIQWKTAKQKKAVLDHVTKLLLQAGQQVPSITHQLESYPLAGAKEGRNEPASPMNLKASGPMTGGLSQRGAHKIGGRR